MSLQSDKIYIKNKRGTKGIAMQKKIILKAIAISKTGIVGLTLFFVNYLIIWIFFNI